MSKTKIHNLNGGSLEKVEAITTINACMKGVMPAYTSFIENLEAESWTHDGKKVTMPEEGNFFEAMRAVILSAKLGNDEELTEAMDKALNIDERAEVSRFRSLFIELEHACNDNVHDDIHTYVCMLNCAEALTCALVRKLIQKTASAYFERLMNAVHACIADSKNQVCGKALTFTAEELKEHTNARAKKAYAIRKVEKQLEELEKLETKKGADVEEKRAVLRALLRKLKDEKADVNAIIEHDHAMHDIYFADMNAKKELYEMASDMITEARAILTEEVHDMQACNKKVDFESVHAYMVLKKQERPAWQEISEDDFNKKEMKVIQHAFRRLRTFVYSVSNPRFIVDSVNRIAEVKGFGSAEECADWLVYEAPKDGALIATADSHGIVSIREEDMRACHSFIDEMNLSKVEENTLNEMRYGFIDEKKRVSNRKIAGMLACNHNNVNKTVKRIENKAFNVIKNRINAGTATPCMQGIYNAMVEPSKVTPFMHEVEIIPVSATVMHEGKACTLKGGMKVVKVSARRVFKLGNTEIVLSIDGGMKATEKVMKAVERKNMQYEARMQACAEAEERAKKRNERRLERKANFHAYKTAHINAVNIGKMDNPIMQVSATAYRACFENETRTGIACMIKGGKAEKTRRAVKVYTRTDADAKTCMQVGIAVSATIERDGKLYTLKGAKTVTRTINRAPLLVEIKGVKKVEHVCMRETYGTPYTLNGGKMKYHARENAPYKNACMDTLEEVTRMHGGKVVKVSATVMHEGKACTLNGGKVVKVHKRG